jgi:hypothetical protein
MYEGCVEVLTIRPTMTQTEIIMSVMTRTNGNCRDDEETSDNGHKGWPQQGNVNNGSHNMIVVLVKMTLTMLTLAIVKVWWG